MSIRVGSVLRLQETATPAETPPGGFSLLYRKFDGQLYFKNAGGTESLVVVPQVTSTDLNDRDTLFWMGI